MTALLDKILPLLNKAVPTGLAVKGLMKSDSKLANFVTNALAAGYSTTAIIDYLRDKSQTYGEKSEKARLSRSSLTPQEKGIQKKQYEAEQAAAIPGALAGLAGGIAGIQNVENEVGNEISSEDRRVATLEQFKNRLKRKESQMQTREDLEAEEIAALSKAPKSKKKKKPGLVEQEMERFNQQYGGSQDAKLQLLQAIQDLNQRMGGLGL